MVVQFEEMEAVIIKDGIKKKSLKESIKNKCEAPQMRILMMKMNNKFPRGSLSKWKS